MTLTAQPKADSPAVDALKRDLRDFLSRSDMIGYDRPVPVAVAATIAEAWRDTPDKEQGFVSFVGSLLDGTGWIVDDEATMYTPGQPARIILLLNY